VTAFSDHLDSEDAVAARLEPFDVVFLMRERTPFPRSLIERLPNLRLLVTSAMRNAAIDVEAADSCGVTVCGTGSLRYPTAELTWALILALTRQVCAEHAAIRRGEWMTSLGTVVNGKTLGIIGLGFLGERIARIGRAFEMDVCAWSHNLTHERALECGAEHVALDELLTRADIVSLHVQLSDRTRGLIGARELGLMKPTAMLVNTSRGQIVDEPSLLDALDAGRIAGAALDVFATEPLPADHRLRTMPNVVLTPHMGYATRESYEIYFREALEDIEAYLRGHPIRVIPPEPET
jgi:phosphoglycerate dehydrogenase-like enzyme